jgi:Domain of unknown function (DUF4105)
MLLCVASVLYSFQSYAQINWYQNNNINDFHPTRYVSIGFSSQNLKAITSMFGHTFLVFHDGESPMPSDHVIEFRGIMGNQVSDYAKALIGTLEGRYELNNFIYKTREYHLDGRDIWIYRLILDENQIQALVMHLKQEINKKSYYSFLNQNCSYFLNVAILKTTKKKDSFKIATIPIQSIRNLKEIGLISDGVDFLPSDYNFIDLQINQLQDSQAKKLNNFFHKNRDEFQPRSEIEKEIYSILLNIKVRTEPSVERRNELFRMKKESALYAKRQLTKVAEDPKEQPGDSYFAVAVNPFSPLSMRISARGAQRSYLSNYKDSYRFSKLEVFRPVIRYDNKHVNLDELNLISLESINQKNFFFNQTDTLFDLSYNDWNHLGYDLKDSILRFGLGKSLLHEDFALTIFPFIGLKYQSTDKNHHLFSDQGLKFIYQYNPSNNFTGRFVILRNIFSNLSLKSIYKMEMSFKIKKDYSLFISAESGSITNTKNLFSEIGLAYLF